MNRLLQYSYPFAFLVYFVANSALCSISHSPLSLGVGYVLLALDILTLFYCIINKKNKSHIPIYILIGLIYYTLSSFLNNPFGKSFFSIGCAVWLISPIFFIMGSYLQSDKVKLSTIYYGILISLFASVPGIMNSFSDIGKQDSSAYFFSYSVLPFILVYYIHLFYSQKTKISYCLIFVSVLLIIASSKRGALLALFPLIICVVLFEYHVRIKKLIPLIVFAIIIMYVVSRIMPDQIQFILDRFAEDDSESFGSGRSYIWSLVLFDYTNSDILGYLFGKGVYSSYQVTGTALEKDYSAHSTYIGLLHDYGIIGLLCYLSIICGMISKSIKAIKKHYKYAYIMLSLVLTLIVIGITEYLFEFYMWFIALYFFWYFTRDFESNINIKEFNK